MGQLPALEGRAVPKRAGLALQDRHVVPRVVGDLAAPEAAGIADLRRAVGRWPASSRTGRPGDRRSGIDTGVDIAYLQGGEDAEGYASAAWMQRVLGAVLAAKAALAAARGA